MRERVHAVDHAGEALVRRRAIFSAAQLTQPTVLMTHTSLRVPTRRRRA
jgi:hypothetical protein